MLSCPQAQGHTATLQVGVSAQIRPAKDAKSQVSEPLAAQGADPVTTQLYLVKCVDTFSDGTTATQLVSLDGTTANAQAYP